MALAAAFSALFLAFPASALAQQYPPSASALSVSDATPDAGQEITIGADGYAANTAVTITFESEPVTIGRVQASSGGAFTTQVRIPADASPGNHTIKATGLAPGGTMRVTSAAITVNGTSATLGAAGSGGSGGSGGPARVAFTGLPTYLLAAVGAGVLATGVVLVALARRRRTAGGAA